MGSSPTRRVFVFFGTFMDALSKTGRRCFRAFRDKVGGIDLFLFFVFCNFTDSVQQKYSIVNEAKCLCANPEIQHISD